VRYAAHSAKIDELLKTLAAVGPRRQLMRELQRYTVNIREKLAEAMLRQGSLTLSVTPGLLVQTAAAGLYHESLGLYTEGVPFDS
jgi:CRISPR-associated endonuclease/helicase Cas3